MAVGELQQELGRPVTRLFALGDGRGPDDQPLAKRLAEFAAEVGHGLEVGSPAAIDPLEDLPAVKARHLHVGEVLLDLGELQLSHVDAIGGIHLSTRNPSLYNSDDSADETSSTLKSAVAA